MDAVIAWVDGNDPNHRSKRLQAMSSLGHDQAKTNNSTHETRFSDLGEVYYCIASILKYAPFIGRIFIVTDNQKPKLLDYFASSGICDSTKITVVDHQELFGGYSGNLPTFNSLSIETMLWNIPGLAETFIYFNDDVFLNSSITLRDLITEDGKIKVYGTRRSTIPLTLKHGLRNFRYRLMGKKNIPAHFKTAQARSATMIGQQHYLQLEHNPHVLRRDTLRDFFLARPDILRQQIAPKFRSISQFLPVGLSNHLEYSLNRLEVLKPDQCTYLKPNTFGPALLEEVASGSRKFGCIQSLDEFTPEHRSLMHATLIRKFRDFLPDEIVNELSHQGAQPTSAQDPDVIAHP